MKYWGTIALSLFVVYLMLWIMIHGIMDRRRPFLPPRLQEHGPTIEPAAPIPPPQ